MGYYTTYKLNIKNNDLNAFSFLEEQAENGSDIGLAFNHDLEPCNWYEYKEDMVALSIMFPDALFELEGEGEKHKDVWRAYFKNGKVQECSAIISYPPFDESKMVDGVPSKNIDSHVMFISKEYKTKMSALSKLTDEEKKVLGLQ